MENNTELLLQMQTKIITDRITDAIQQSEKRTGDRIDKLTAAQVIANGRTTKLERGLATLRAKMQKHTQQGSFFGSLTAKQKAKVYGSLALVAGAIVEGLHRLIPALFNLLMTKVGQ